MSTLYYPLKSPITSVRLETNGFHNKLTIWVNHALSGTLILRAEETPFILGLLADRDQPVLRTHYGGAKMGVVVTGKKAGLPDNMCVISEYGELFGVAEVRARGGTVSEERKP